MVEGNTVAEEFFFLSSIPRERGNGERQNFTAEGNAAGGEKKLFFFRPARERGGTEGARERGGGETEFYDGS